MDALFDCTITKTKAAELARFYQGCANSAEPKYRVSYYQKQADRFAALAK